MRSKKTKKIEKQLDNLVSTLQKLEKEHENCRLVGTQEDLELWLDSMPITDLQDLYNCENNLPLNKFTKEKMLKKFAIRKEFLKIEEEYFILQHKVSESYIDDLLDYVKAI